MHLSPSSAITYLYCFSVVGLLQDRGLILFRVLSVLLVLLLDGIGQDSRNILALQVGGVSGGCLCLHHFLEQLLLLLQFLHGGSEQRLLSVLLDPLLFDGLNWMGLLLPALAGFVHLVHYQVQA